MPRWRKVICIARKEFRDILRDRRTIFMAIIFPLLLYPLLIIGLMQATAVQETKMRRERPVVAIAGGEYAPELRDEIGRAKGLKTVEFGGEIEELKTLRADAGVVIPREFKEQLARNGTAEVGVIYDSANEMSLAARDKVENVIDGYSREVLAGRLKAASLDSSFVRPLELRDTDIATPRQRGVFRLGRMLAFLLVIFCLMGALYPALDAVSGEKERGTLETLLSIPATRLEILSGKYVAVFSMSIASVASNFVSLSITMLMVNRLLEGASPRGELPIDFTIPLSAVGLMVPALVPLAAFYSAVSLGIASFAKSTREGQYYFGPLYAVCLPLTAAAIVPGMKLTYLTALAPVMSISLFLKDGLLGTLEAGPTVVALVAQCIYAAAAMKWAAMVFSREDVLFPSPSTNGETAPGAAGYAKPSHAIFVWAVSVILFFYMGAILMQRLGALSVVAGVVLYGGFVIGPALALFFVDRLDAKKVLPFGWPGMRGLLATAAFVPGAVLVAIAANAVQQAILKMPGGTGGSLYQDASVWALFVSVVALPALCEEIFYRGILLRSFAARMPMRWAIVLSAVLFAAAHLNVFEALPLFVLGVVLAIVANRCGTLLAPMIVHLATNGLTVLVDLAQRSGSNAWWAAAARAEFDWWGGTAAGVAGIVLIALGVRLTGRGRGGAP